jgi:hypothetical protein
MQLAPKTPRAGLTVWAGLTVYWLAAPIGMQDRHAGQHPQGCVPTHFHDSRA